MARSSSRAKSGAARRLRCGFPRTPIGRSKWLQVRGRDGMFRTLVKTDALSVADQTVAVRYFELRTMRGARRYSAEILLAPGDRSTLDDDSLTNLEARTHVIVTGTLYSLLLAQRAVVAEW